MRKFEQLGLQLCGIVLLSFSLFLGWKTYFVITFDNTHSFQHKEHTFLSVVKRHSGKYGKLPTEQAKLGTQKESIIALWHIPLETTEAVMIDYI